MRTPSVSRAYPLRGTNARPSDSSTASRNLCAASFPSPRTPDLDDGMRSNAEPVQEQWVEAEAFSSVHDLVHHAILSQPGRCASLRQIYETCEKQGRIAYKRSGGSRNITANEHWKSQIRHALYTSARFCRAPNNDDCWSVARGHTEKPATTTVRIDLSAANSTPASTRRDTTGPNSASGRKRQRGASSADPLVSPRRTNKSRGKKAASGAPPSEAATPVSSSATSSASGGGGITSPRTARARPAHVPRPRNSLFQQLTPEPHTPDILTASLDTANILSALAAAHDGNTLIPPGGAPPKKRLKAAAAAAAAMATSASFHDSASKAASSADSDEIEEGEDMEEVEEPKVVSLRDPSRNRRKPPKTPVAVYVPTQEPAPPPRDVTRNRRKGKAERASEGYIPVTRGGLTAAARAAAGSKISGNTASKGGSSVGENSVQSNKLQNKKLSASNIMELKLKPDTKPFSEIRTGPVSQRELKYDDVAADL
mmetsp:Transcript_29833/g.65204  ORF Transcript_29833/g.65204 Transcript_29833/m.65204 type:complete len:484 (-) Transcript_29833:388-1839(-)